MADDQGQKGEERPAWNAGHTRCTTPSITRTPRGWCIPSNTGSTIPWDHHTLHNRVHRLLHRTHLHRVAWNTIQKKQHSTLPQGTNILQVMDNSSTLQTGYPGGYQAIAQGVYPPQNDYEGVGYPPSGQGTVVTSQARTRGSCRHPSQNRAKTTDIPYVISFHVPLL